MDAGSTSRNEAQVDNEVAHGAETSAEVSSVEVTEETILQIIRIVIKLAVCNVGVGI